MTRVIDCGHGGFVANGGSSPIGVVGPSGLSEKQVTLALGQELAAILPGAVLTRDGDANPSLFDRISLSRRFGARTFISLHANSGPPGVRGAELWIHPRASQASRALASSIERALVRFGAPYRGTFSGELAVLAPELHAPHTAACLLELDYLSDAQAERRLSDPRSRSELARAIAQGIEFDQDPNPTIQVSDKRPWDTHKVQVRGGPGPMVVTFNATLSGTLPEGVRFQVSILTAQSENAATQKTYRIFDIEPDLPLLGNVNFAAESSEELWISFTLIARNGNTGSATGATNYSITGTYELNTR